MSATLPLKPVGIVYGSDNAPVVMDVFVDPLCPFSKKAYPIVKRLVDHSSNMLQAKFTCYLQPYHAQSIPITKVLLAAYIMTDNNKNFFSMLEYVYDNLNNYSDDNTYDVSPKQIIHQLADVANTQFGINKLDIFDGAASAEVHQELRYHTRYGRQNSVHWTPTFMVNGIIVPGADSQWNESQWMKSLEPLFTAAAAVKEKSSQSQSQSQTHGFQQQQQQVPSSGLYEKSHHSSPHHHSHHHAHHEPSVATAAIGQEKESPQQQQVFEQMMTSKGDQYQQRQGDKR